MVIYVSALQKYYASVTTQLTVNLSGGHTLLQSYCGGSIKLCVVAIMCSYSTVATTCSLLVAAVSSTRNCEQY